MCFFDDILIFSCASNLHADVVVDIRGAEALLQETRHPPAQLGFYREKRANSRLFFFKQQQR